MFEYSSILKKICPAVFILSLLFSGCFYTPYDVTSNNKEEDVGYELKKRIYSINNFADDIPKSLLVQLIPNSGRSNESDLYECSEKGTYTTNLGQTFSTGEMLIKYMITDNQISAASTINDSYYISDEGEKVYSFIDGNVSSCDTIPKEMLSELEVIENRLKIWHITRFTSHSAGLKYVKSIEPTDEETMTYMHNIELYYDSLISSNELFLSLYLNDVNRVLFGNNSKGVNHNSFFNENFEDRIKEVNELNAIFVNSNSNYSDFSKLVKILKEDLFKGLNLNDLNNFYSVDLVEDGTSKLYKHNDRFIGVQDSVVTKLYADHLSEYYSIDEKFISKAKAEVYLNILDEYESTLSDSTFHVTSISTDDDRFARCLEKNVSEMVDEVSRIKIEKECTAASTDTLGYYKENVLFTEQHEFHLKLEEQILIDGISLKSALGYEKKSRGFYVKINNTKYQLNELFKLDYGDIVGLLQNNHPEIEMRWISENSFISNESDVLLN